MGLRINSNVLALNAQHNLSATTAKLATSLQRLSTGLRINSGKDDVVGLLKSESLRTQIRGISAAELNLSNAQSLLGVAEGSLSQLTDLAQRLRENVVQAADASLSSADRTNLSLSVNDLRQEFSRLALASEFDGVKLLTGTFSSKTFQVGPNATDQLSLTIADARSSAIGKVAVLTGKTVNFTTSGIGTFDRTTLLLSDNSGITINGVSFTTADLVSDGVSGVQASESALAWVNALNNVSGVTNVKALVLSNVVTLTYTVSTALSAGDRVFVNGVALLQANYSNDDTGATMFATAINSVTASTGVTATIDTNTDALVLTATDGRNIDVVLSRSFALASVASQSNLFGIDNVAISSTFSDFGILYRGNFKLYSDSNFVVVGASGTHEFTASTAAGSVSLNSATSLDYVNVATTSNAQEGVFILDNVIRQLQNKRADVGSKAIRFGVAETELGIRKENLTSAESRIRDADVAVETAFLTQFQILQQAGASVLQRANSAPQIALTLLQQ